MECDDFCGVASLRKKIDMMNDKWEDRSTLVVVSTNYKVVFLQKLHEVSGVLPLPQTCLADATHLKKRKRKQMHDNKTQVAAAVAVEAAKRANTSRRKEEKEDHFQNLVTPLTSDIS